MTIKQTFVSIVALLATVTAGFAQEAGSGATPTQTTNTATNQGGTQGATQGIVSQQNRANDDSATLSLQASFSAQAQAALDAGGNVLDIQQTGVNNDVGYLGEGIVQTDSGNSFTVLQSGDRDQIGEVKQTGQPVSTSAVNTLSIIQKDTKNYSLNSQDENAVVRAYQTVSGDGKSNAASIVMDGKGNHINRLEQITSADADIDLGNVFTAYLEGIDNGLGEFSASGFAAGIAAGLNGWIVQHVGSNIIDLKIIGNDNKFSVSQLNGGQQLRALDIKSNDPAIYIQGDDNEVAISQSKGRHSLTLGRITGRANIIAVKQDGDSAYGETAVFDPVAGSNRNNVRFVQSGSGDVIEVTMLGDENTIDVEQDKTSVAHRVSVNITGEQNNFQDFQSSVVKNAVLQAVNASIGLTELAAGQIRAKGGTGFQSYTLNENLKLVVYGDRNLFASFQDGVGNVAQMNQGAQGEESFSSEAVIIQSGNSNAAYGLQKGQNNSMAIVQTRN